MAKLVVEVCVVSNVLPHPNAQKLDICQVRGWQCVVGKGKYHDGDKVVYFQPDSLLPREWAVKFGVEKYLSFGTRYPEMGRVRATSLRGEPSQGLVVDPADPSWEVGKDVSDYYGVKKYDPPPIPLKAGDIESDHPFFPCYTEIENLRNYPNVFQLGEIVAVTEKIHGCFRGDAKVMLANGEEAEISKLPVGIMVLSYNQKTSNYEPNRVKNILKRPPAGNWVEMIFGGNHQVICTDDHLFLTRNRGYVAAKDLSEYDDVISFFD